MITNLFSIFDPTLSLFNLMPISFIYFILIIPLFTWSSSFVSYIFTKICCFLMNEIEYSMGFLNKGVAKIIGSVFMVVCFFNLFALFPFIFSLTSHITITFPLSFSFWLIIILFSWSNFMYNFLSHLIPVGTPVSLMSFMVIVELVRNLIRPVALTFRLTANMMAGHLLISLIGRFLVNLNISYLIIGSLFQILLVFMELGVSIIQAYVFFTLLVLYMREMSSH